MSKSIAVAYTMKKKAKKMSQGGVPYSKMEESKRSNMASGGTVKSGDPEMDYAEGGEVQESLGQFGARMRKNKIQDQENFNLAQNRHKKTAPQDAKPPQPNSMGPGYSKGGEVKCAHCGGNMSEGGMVANAQGPGVDSLQNEFDDLALRDGLEFSETGANSGDELGGPSKDDLVARAMLRKKAKR